MIFYFNTFILIPVQKYRFSFGYKLPVFCTTTIYFLGTGRLFSFWTKDCRRGEEIAVIHRVTRLGPKARQLSNNIAHIYFPLHPVYRSFGREVNFSDTDISYDLWNCHSLQLIFIFTEHLGGTYQRECQDNVGKFPHIHFLTSLLKHSMEHLIYDGAVCDGVYHSFKVSHAFLYHFFQ